MINSLENSKKFVSEQVNSEQQVSSLELTVHCSLFSFSLPYRRLCPSTLYMKRTPRKDPILREAWFCAIMNWPII